MRQSKAKEKDMSISLKQWQLYCCEVYSCEVQSYFQLVHSSTSGWVDLTSGAVHFKEITESSDLW